MYATIPSNHSATCLQASSKSPTQKIHEAPLQPLAPSSSSTKDAAKLRSTEATEQLPRTLSTVIPAEVRQESESPSPSEPSSSVADIKEPATPKTPAKLSNRPAAYSPARSTSPRRDFEAEARRRKQRMPFTPKLLPRKQASSVAASPQRPLDVKVKSVVKQAAEALEQETQRQTDRLQRVQILSEKHARDAAAQDTRRVKREGAASAKEEQKEELRLKRLAVRNPQVVPPPASDSRVGDWFRSQLAAVKDSMRNASHRFNCYSSGPKPPADAQLLQSVPQPHPK